MIQLKADKKTKVYYVLYTTERKLGFSILKVTWEEKGGISMSKILVSSDYGLQFEKGLMAATVSGSTAVLLCDNKAVQITFKNKKAVAAEK